jgi:hypothetical protein
MKVAAIDDHAGLVVDDTVVDDTVVDVATASEGPLRAGSDGPVRAVGRASGSNAPHPQELPLGLGDCCVRRGQGASPSEHRRAAAPIAIEPTAVARRNCR